MTGSVVVTGKAHTYREWRLDRLCSDHPGDRYLLERHVWVRSYQGLRGIRPVDVIHLDGTGHLDLHLVCELDWLTQQSKQLGWWRGAA